MLCWVLLLAMSLVAGENSTSGHLNLTLMATEVFKFSFNPNYFNWSMMSGATRYTYRYRPSILGMPGLPSWLKYKYSERHRAGFLYGVPPSLGTTPIQVVATNLDTYQTGLLTMNLSVVRNPLPAVNHIRLRIDNFNIEDIFDRIDKLKKLFRNRFWMESHEDLYLTMAESVLSLGGRKPLRPSQKDGVVVQLGSNANFSSRLMELDRETQPLRKLDSCSFKKTSVERHFRQEGFAMDWCGFRLFTTDSGSLVPWPLSPAAADKPPSVPVIPTNDDLSAGRDWHFAVREDLPVRSYQHELALAASVPLLVLLVFSLALAAVLWARCPGDNNDNIVIESIFDVFNDCLPSKIKADNTNLAWNNNNSQVAPEMLETRNQRASSVQRQTDTLRSLARQRTVTPMLQSTPPASVEGSSLHTKSRTASPCGSVLYGSPNGTMRQSINWEMFDSLNRPNPPPYDGTLPRRGGVRRSGVDREDDLMRRSHQEDDLMRRSLMDQSKDLLRRSGVDQEDDHMRRSLMDQSEDLLRRSGADQGEDLMRRSRAQVGEDLEGS